MGSGFTIDVVVQLSNRYADSQSMTISKQVDGGLPGTGGSKELHRAGTVTR